MNFIQQYGKNHQSCQQNKFYYAVWQLLLYYYREFPSKILSVYYNVLDLIYNILIVDFSVFYLNYRTVVKIADDDFPSVSLCRRFFYLVVSNSICAARVRILYNLFGFSMYAWWTYSPSRMIIRPLYAATYRVS